MFLLELRELGPAMVGSMFHFVANNLELSGLLLIAFFTVFSLVLGGFIVLVDTIFGE